MWVLPISRPKGWSGCLYVTLLAWTCILSRVRLAACISTSCLAERWNMENVGDNGHKTMTFNIWRLKFPHPITPLPAKTSYFIWVPVCKRHSILGLFRVESWLLENRHPCNTVRQRDPVSLYRGEFRYDSEDFLTFRWISCWFWTDRWCFVWSSIAVLRQRASVMTSGRLWITWGITVIDSKAEVAAPMLQRNE